jgi:signal recognition particle subunit SRP54
MLDTLTQGFRAARNRLKGFKEISAKTVEEAVKDIRISLLEADVEYHVVQDFLARVREKALGEVVLTKVEHKGQKLSVSPAEHFVKICHDELVATMGEGDATLLPSKDGITRVMLAGLQGSGKTTTAAKLAHNYKEQGKKPLLVAADIYRPAAVEQLKVMGERVGVPVYHEAGATPPDLCVGALAFAKANKLDLVIFDTAGRLAIDDFLMMELEEIVRRTSVPNIVLVVDAMVGQDAVKTAAEFNRRLELSGVILTKLDGDARGGAALSVRNVTGKPIKFVGMGEGIHQLEEFRPEGLASRILGFGDVVGLMKDFTRVVDEKQAEDDAMRMLSGGFSFMDFLEQVKVIRKMGSLKDLMDKLPIFPDGMPGGMDVDDKALVRIEAIIHSMTPRERMRPDIIEPSRMKRIARGSGTGEKEVADLLMRFKAMKDLMGHVGQNPGILGRLPGFKQLAQAKAMKGMDFNQYLPKGGMPGAGGGPGGMAPGQRASMSATDKAKARKKQKMAKQQRKKQRKKK